MENVVIGLRAQDFHESLRLTAPFGPKDVHYKWTLLIGKAASLAMHLRGLLFIEDLTQLEYAASSLGISSLELPAVLHELQEVGFLSVVKAGDKIKRIEVRVPEFRSGYAELGERWKQLKPSEIENASILTLDRLYHGPVSESELIGSLGLGRRELSILADVMKTGQLISVHPVDGEPMAFTPLAVDANPNAYLQWAKRFPGEVRTLLEKLRMLQGLPVTDPAIANNPALTDAVMTGVLMPVQVGGATGEQRFIFAPRGGLSPEERIVLDKARAILACVRYGERFAAGRPIKYPRRILETLRDKKQFKKGHPDLFAQYGLLAERLIGHPVAETGGRWNFRLDDTPENMKALGIAIEMLEHGETPSARIDLEAQKALLAPSGYLSPASTRPRWAETIEPSAETRAEIIRQMGNLARGMGSI